MYVCSFQSIDWESVKWDELKPEEKWRLEHMRLHEKHRGHESMHAEMILILFATLVISQIALVKWKQIYPHAYHVSCSFFGELSLLVWKPNGFKKCWCSIAILATVGLNYVWKILLLQNWIMTHFEAICTHCATERGSCYKCSFAASTPDWR